MKNSSFTLSLLTMAIMISSQSQAASDWYSAMQDTTASAKLNLRYEGVEQDNAVDDADALTLRTELSLTTGQYKGFSITVALEDVRAVAGIDDYSVPPAGFKPGEYSVIADPETTELHQGYLQYQTEGLTLKAGRQIIALDGHRFVGHVGWRQDWQTFDALSAGYKRGQFSAYYAYVTQRNRIFAEAADMDSKDHLLNASYASDFGKFTAYAYLLETDNDIDNSLNTYGISYSGKYTADTLTWLYAAEFATQTNDAAGVEYDADYTMLEGGVVFGGVTAKVNYEVLGSDDGMYGFATPLATLHKFNGWSDQFLVTPAQGLEDLSVSLSGKAYQGKWLVAYHNFEADKASDTVSDLGSELNVQYVTKLGDAFTLGVKYATYSADDAKVDTDKLWVWLSTAF